MMKSSLSFIQSARRGGDLEEHGRKLSGSSVIWADLWVEKPPLAAVVGEWGEAAKPQEACSCGLGKYEGG